MFKILQDPNTRLSRWVRSIKNNWFKFFVILIISINIGYLYIAAFHKPVKTDIALESSNAACLEGIRYTELKFKSGNICLIKVVPEEACGLWQNEEK